MEYSKYLPTRRSLVASLLVSPLSILPFLLFVSSQPLAVARKDETAPLSNPFEAYILSGDDPPVFALTAITSVAEPVQPETPPVPEPQPKPEPEPEPEITWRDNPQGCNEAVEWIAAEEPFYCIPKPNAPQRATARLASVSMPQGSYATPPNLSLALATPYVWGGNAIGAGWDCSALTQYYAQVIHGRAIPRTVAAQYNALLKVPASEARYGDLVIHSMGHVSLYLGGGYVLQALNPAQGTMITTLDDAIQYNGLVSFVRP